MLDQVEKAKALIFDCDGTLADTMPTHFQAWRDTLAEFNLFVDEARLLRMSSPTIEELKQMSAEYGFQVDQPLFCERKEQRFRSLVKQIIPIDAVIDVAKENYGKKPIALISSGARENVELTLAEIGLSGKFDLIITADDTKLHKPSPEIFIEVARQLDVLLEECLVFEDSQACLDCAINLRMDVVDVRKLRQ